MSIIELKNISYGYGEKELFGNFSLTFESQQITCLLGSSGCGKTTILRLIAGLELPKEGELIIQNQVASANNKLLQPPHKRGVGYIFQDLALWPHLSVYKNVSFGLEQNKQAHIQERVLDILEFFDLKEHIDKYPHQLSGGQQQLLAIARSLAMQPSILLMDEPLANLDVKLKHKILRYIKEVKQKFDISIIYVTHDHKEAFAIADQIVVMNQGKIEDQGSPDEIKSSKNEYVKFFLEY